MQFASVVARAAVKLISAKFMSAAGSTLRRRLPEKLILEQQLLERLLLERLLLERLVSVFVGERQPAKPLWRIHLHLHLMPFGFARKISRIKAH
jgi:hypothetical protein